MNILTIAGTRPELIRLSEIIKKLDMVSNNVFVYTNQNCVPELSDIFFSDLGIRKPDVVFDPPGSIFADQLGSMLVQLDKFLGMPFTLKFDKALILGDTNSALLSILLARKGIPVYHIEGGNRCFSALSPEEVNRNIIDHCVSKHLVYSERSKQNLLNEGIHISNIYTIGNPIVEVLEIQRSLNDAKHAISRDLSGEVSDTLSQYHIDCSFKKTLALCTIHRGETVSNRKILEDIFIELGKACEQFNMEILFPVHPKTRDYLNKWAIVVHENICLCSPVPFSVMNTLYDNCDLVITDSGTVCEEACILKIPCVILRDYSERLECAEVGGYILAGVPGKKNNFLDCIRASLFLSPNSSLPAEYLKKDVSDTVAKIMVGI